jgi:hypothetical protein
MSNSIESKIKISLRFHNDRLLTFDELGLVKSSGTYYITQAQQLPDLKYWDRLHRSKAAAYGLLEPHTPPLIKYSHLPIRFSDPSTPKTMIPPLSVCPLMARSRIISHLELPRVGGRF